METVAVHLAEGFEEIEAISIIDVLRRAQIPVTTVSITAKLEVEGAHAIIVKADKLFDDINYAKVGMIILPGGMPGSSNLDQHEGLRKQILSFHEQNKALGAICAAPIVFGKLGILAGEKATCYPGFEKYLQGAEISNSRIAKSGNIITGKGAGVAIEFALKVVEYLIDRPTAEDLAKKLVIEC